MKKKFSIVLLSFGISALLVACGNTAGKTKEVKNTDDNKGIVVKLEDEKKDDSSKDKSTDINLDEKAALNVALEDAKVKEADIVIIKVKEKKHDSKEYFDIKFTHEGKEYEYEITKSGEIKEKEVDDIRNDTSIIKDNNLISNNEAKKIAIEKAGVPESDLADYEIDLDEDNGKYKYKIEFKVNNKDYEYKIDASNGSILEEKIDD